MSEARVFNLFAANIAWLVNDARQRAVSTEVRCNKIFDRFKHERAGVTHVEEAVPIHSNARVSHFIVVEKGKHGLWSVQRAAHHKAAMPTVLSQESGGNVSRVEPAKVSLSVP